MKHHIPARATAQEGQLAEVWGDVVSRPQLGRAIVIGAVVSVAVYWIALHTIAPMAETPAIGKALAMLAGVLGCLVGGTISARLFRPKRVVVEEVPAGATWQTEILDQIEQEGGPFGRVEDLPPAVVREMKDVGLYEVFRAHEQKRTGA
ncbi:hypothetical protein D2T29_20510 [Sinirhodobacter populi]|uniref:Uncharacterized protein n=1 Tax=Paenirhodobacter populi TaxID=2306993 RepID=A0A443K173_9RHOB|nr:hypothetical protein [Sinirhodobacter populi]RWR26499.1 hypothetical protein D2T29_20510 [Sinirhodobacter populi]